MATDRHSVIAQATRFRCASSKSDGLRADGQICVRVFIDVGRSRSQNGDARWRWSCSGQLGGTTMARRPIDADALLNHAKPLTHQHAHEIQIVLEEARAMARRAAAAGDDGTNDLIVSEVVRRNELQVWFVAEHVVDVPLVAV
jgi:hypothetical protein